MESDRRYFIEGLFVIGFAVAIALFFVWIAKAGRSDDVLYRIHFEESVSGLALGDPVKFHGLDVGTVKSMVIDPSDARFTVVDVSVHKETPVTTDTRAMLKLKGITGVVFIELFGGNGQAQSLVAATPPGQVPEIRAEKSALATVLDELPKIVARFSAIETQAGKVLADVGATTGKIKEDPSVLLRGPKEKPRPTQPIAKQ